MSNLSLPGNPRYQPAQLVPIFGYDNLYRAVGMVEIATLRTLAEIGVITADEIATLTPEVEAAILAITTTEVDEVERKVTQHDIRAWVQIAQQKVDPRLKRWIHVPLTSYDALDTARAIQFHRAHEVVRTLTDELIGHFATQASTHARTLQIGRTHGQHALPVTVGFWFATILSRLLAGIESANRAADALVGKISGAVGAHNAQVGLGFEERCGNISFEERVLSKLGLKPARISTQILPPEPLADYLFACMKITAALGQFGRDGRHLMRTEIGEIGEPFQKGQVGSSTMAHKRNPINFESLESNWLKSQAEVGKVLSLMVSEHQRDLVGSAVARDLPIIVVNLVTQLNTLLRKKDGVPFILRLSVDEAALERNFKAQGDTILAEPIYIALQMAGYEGDAHKLVNEEAMPYAKENSMALLSAVLTVLQFEYDRMGKVWSEVWGNIPPETRALLQDPSKYTGDAATKALQIVDLADAYLRGE